MAAAKITVTGSTYGLPPGLRPGLSKPVAGANATRTQVPVGWIALQPEDVPDLAVLAELGDTAPDPSEGYGGWNIVPRQHDKALTTWQGYQPLTVDIDLWIDGLTAGITIDRHIDNLEALAGRGAKRIDGQPPTLIVDTAGVFRYDAGTFPTMRWVINAIQWDREQALSDDDGHRVRAACTITLLEYVDVARLRDRALQRRLQRQTKTAKTNKVHIAKDGETLITIARKELHDAGRWPELAKLNGIRDPLSIKTGARIKLP